MRCGAASTELAQARSRASCWRDIRGAFRMFGRRGFVALAVVLAVVMHAAAWPAAKGLAARTPDAAAVTRSRPGVLFVLLLMAAQALNGVTRALYGRGDLDLLFSSPISARQLLFVRAAGDRLRRGRFRGHLRGADHRCGASHRRLARSGVAAGARRRGASGGRARPCDGGRPLRAGRPEARPARGADRRDLHGRRLHAGPAVRPAPAEAGAARPVLACRDAPPGPARSHPAGARRRGRAAGARGLVPRLLALFTLATLGLGPRFLRQAMAASTAEKPAGLPPNAAEPRAARSGPTARHPAPQGAADHPPRPVDRLADPAAAALHHAAVRGALARRHRAARPWSRWPRPSSWSASSSRLR